MKNNNKIIILFKHKPCNPFFLRRFIKKHKTADVKSSINPVPITPKTKTMYGFVLAVEFLLGEITLGSIGVGVDGSALSEKKLRIIIKQISF